MFRFLVVLVLVLIAAAALTRPGPETVETAIGAMIRSEIEAGSLDDIQDPVAALLFAACKADANACADLARLGLSVGYVDRKLFAQVNVAGYGRSANCLAAFTQVFCPSGLRR
ncbi:hypothetical protein EU803_10780 [Loktanella sp. IMCC34160]|uniref:hypothetical protein n=1 Tax=Loktanella sp. IMCC34160 TaxID=2510646 RepID=UPI00101BEC9A|nr:hypothetical protein [Loktanella sp. IMCC34160]RYG91562.1 hypothetical protein EU803_10780 [Loktanella sp. IMCC34160]